MRLSYISASSIAASAIAGGKVISSRMPTAHIARHVPSPSRLRDDADLTAVANKAKSCEKLITIPGLAALL